MISQNNHVLVTQEVQKVIRKETIIETTAYTTSFVFQIFLVKKKEGGQCPVINLKALNQLVRVEHFKMERLHLLPDLIQQEDWMIKMDLKDAYLQVPIHEVHQCFLQFAWEGRHYKFQCLPFGFSSAQRVFTMLMKPVVGLLRQIGLHLIIYLDDMLFMYSNREQLESMVPMILSLLEALGLMVNKIKFLLKPTELIEFLGFIINSHNLRLPLPHWCALNKISKQIDSSSIIQPTPGPMVGVQ